eukprot:7130650-Prymnesium_polylepis.2
MLPTERAARRARRSLRGGVCAATLYAWRGMCRGHRCTWSQLRCGACASPRCACCAPVDLALVAVRVEEVAVRTLAVAAGAARLLHVTLEALWQRVVDDETHIRLQAVGRAISCGIRARQEVVLHSGWRSG